MTAFEKAGVASKAGPRAALAVLALLLVPSAMTRARPVPVAATDNLQAKIDGAAGGDVLLLGSGTYGGFRIHDRHFTADQPLIIRAAPGARPLILGHNYDGYLAHLTNSSYVVLDGLAMENSNQPIYGVTVDHLILANLEIHHTGQEIIHIQGTSRYVDILNCRLSDTGHTRDQWCEGIYIGMGQPPFQNVEHVWIEGNEIFATGHAEGINIKARSYHITIRGNRVHDVAPGTATQYNQAAISFEAADLTFRPGIDPDLWVENNEVYNVRFGRWANGLQVSTAGGRIVNNHIHDCAEFGLEFNAYGRGPGVFTTWLWKNRVENCAAGAANPTDLPRKEADPGPNPNQPQTWYLAARAPRTDAR
jgi:hypothetical protein